MHKWIFPMLKHWRGCREASIRKQALTVLYHRNAEVWHIKLQKGGPSCETAVGPALSFTSVSPDNMQANSFVHMYNKSKQYCAVWMRQQLHSSIDRISLFLLVFASRRRFPLLFNEQDWVQWNADTYILYSGHDHGSTILDCLSKTRHVSMEVMLKIMFATGLELKIV